MSSCGVWGLECVSEWLRRVGSGVHQLSGCSVWGVECVSEWLWRVGSGVRELSVCCVWAQEFCHMCLVAPQHVESFQTRD